IQDGSPISEFRPIIYTYGHLFGGWKTGEFNNRSFDNLHSAGPQADAVIAKAVKSLGGEKYLNVKSQVGRGKFSSIKEGAVVSFQTFIDVIVFPDKERTDFRGQGVRSVQTNIGETGWIFDGDQELIKIQTEKQIDGFKQSMRTSLDNLLRGHWRGKASVSFAGHRQASLGKRNDVIKLTYDDGFVVEFEFSDDGLPQKAIYKLGAEGEESKEEDRYAQFVDVGGIKTPFIIDRFTNGEANSRINYESVEFNKTIPDSIFEKPATKKALKEIKL
ncbi:MAG: hypothetical protein ABI539_02680, partial [Acidobacteriota bacterium]